MHIALPYALQMLKLNPTRLGLTLGVALSGRCPLYQGAPTWSGASSWVLGLQASAMALNASDVHDFHVMPLLLPDER